MRFSEISLIDHAQLQVAERLPAAEVRESTEAYQVVLELPGVDRAAIEVKATERTLLITAERRNQRQQLASVEGTADAEAGAGSAAPVPLLRECRYGTWSRSFRFPQPIERDQLQAVYRDGLLTVQVEG